MTSKKVNKDFKRSSSDNTLFALHPESPSSTNPTVASQSSPYEVDHDDRRITSVTTLSSGTLLKMNEALSHLSPQVQGQLLKRFFDDALAARLPVPVVSPSASVQPVTLVLRPQFDPHDTCALNILPPELRLKIFRLVFPAEWHGKVPALIKALRPVSKLYYEAVAGFFTREKHFRLHKKNDWSFRNMSDKALLSIGRVDINLEDGRDDPRLPDNPTPNVRYLQSVFHKCSRVYLVTIRVPFGRNGFWPLLSEDYITKFLVGFSQLARVYFKIPNTYMSQIVIGCLRPGKIGGIIEHTNKLLETSATVGDVSIIPELPDPVLITTIYNGGEQDPTRRAYSFAYLEDEDLEGWSMFQPRPKMETWQWNPKNGMDWLPKIKQG